MKAAIRLFPGGKCRDNGLCKEMIFKIAEVVRIPQQKIGERKSGEAGLTGGAEIEGPATDIRLRVVVIAGLVLQADVIPVPPAHQSKTRGEIVLRISILNKTLSLRTHDVVGKIGDTWSRRGSRTRRYGRVVARGPPD